MLKMQQNEHEAQKATVEDLRMSMQERSQMATLLKELGDDPSTMGQVSVSLADGTKIEMLMTKGGVMVALDGRPEEGKELRCLQDLLHQHPG